MNNLEIKYYKNLTKVPLKTRRYLEDLVNDEISCMTWQLEMPEEYKSLKAFIAYSGKSIVGWSTAFLIKDEDDPLPNYSINIFVKPKYRRKGVGTKLFECMRSKIKERLTVSKFTDQAKNFYDSLDAGLEEY